MASSVVWPLLLRLWTVSTIMVCALAVVARLSFSWLLWLIAVCDHVLFGATVSATPGSDLAGLGAVSQSVTFLLAVGADDLDNV